MYYEKIQENKRIIYKMKSFIQRKKVLQYSNYIGVSDYD